jgi:hypothetical protein
MFKVTERLPSGTIQDKGFFVTEQAAKGHCTTMSRIFPDNAYAYGPAGGEIVTIMTTYRMADGSLLGEQSMVFDTEFFDSASQPCEVIEEVWELKQTRKLSLPEGLD